MIQTNPYKTPGSFTSWILGFIRPLQTIAIHPIIVQWGAAPQTAVFVELETMMW